MRPLGRPVGFGAVAGVTCNAASARHALCEADRMVVNTVPSMRAGLVAADALERRSGCAPPQVPSRGHSI
jgi:hypothetical protein